VESRAMITPQFSELLGPLFGSAETSALFTDHARLQRKSHRTPFEGHALIRLVRDSKSWRSVRQAERP
jgi:hypothetical protein